jgi:integrase
MQIYTDWLGKSPSELLLEAENESTLLMRQRHLKSYLINFRKYLQDTRAPTTVRGYLTGVKSFYTLFDIGLPTLPRENKKASTLERNNKIPTKEDLQQVLKICDPLEKALLLVGASSGLSAQEIINLTVADFKYDADFITTLEVRRTKTGVEFCTFLSPEATKAVVDYIEYRDREGKTKRCVQHVKQNITSKNDFLFIKRHVPASYAETQDDGERALDLEAFVKIYRAISTKAKKNTPIGTWNTIRSHNIRKVYNSALYNAGADSWFIEYTMGHAVDNTRAAYLRVQPDKIKEIYKKYIPYLTIQKELDFSTSNEFKDLKKESEKYKALMYKYFTQCLELSHENNQLIREKAKYMTEKEKKDYILNWAEKYETNNETEKELIEEIKKVVKDEWPD